MSDQDVVSRLNAALEVRYRVERKLGEGGMATVYLAEDRKHERKVALKVLKPELAAVVGAERFLAEIKTTANLQHPHILPLHDSGNADGFLFYVMPYVEGESLRERLDRVHQLGVDEAVEIARNVAEALDYAHRHGVIHRDIKPANILLQDGKPVVSDFGIALAVSAGGAGRLTETGLSLGTPHYMSPEQATGDLSVGAASDIYALACVLYEMLVGEPPYTGSTPQAILGKIIQAKPVSPTEARTTIPANVDAAIRKALEKVPADRFTSAQGFAAAVADPHFRYGETPALAARASAGPWKRISIATSAAAAVFAVAFLWALLRPDAPLPTTRLTIDFPDDQELSGNATYDISPDGQMLVYEGPAASGEGFQLWARRLDALEAVPIRDTEEALILPAISPDGAEVAFDVGDAIRIVSVQGGISRTVAPDAVRCCVRWGPAGAWLYFNDPDNGLSRVPSAGGPVEIVTRRDTEKGDGQHIFIEVLPGGQAAVFTITRSNTPPTIAAVSFRSGEIRDLTQGLFPRYAQGQLLFTDPDAGTLFAQPFDVDALELRGSAVPVAEGLRPATSGWTYYAASQTGTLVYTTGGARGSFPTDLVEVSPDGGASVLAELDDRAVYPRYSPDGRRIAYATAADPPPTSTGETDLWVLDPARGTTTRLTFGGTNNRFYPIWTRDGTRITHADASTAENRLVMTPADGSGGSEVLLELGPRRFPTSWSPDGRTLAYYVGPQGTPTNSRDLWLLHMNGAAPETEAFVETPFMERGAIFSPDGRWLAYVSDKSGQNDVYVRPFPGPGMETTISAGGGSEPVWAPSGDELYYRREDELLAVSVTENGSSLTVGRPRHVLDDPYMRDTGGAAGGVANYDVAPDGRGFVMVEVGEAIQGAGYRTNIVLNWIEELRRRAP